MAIRPAAAKKTPAKKPAARTPVAVANSKSVVPAPKAKAVAAPVVTLKTVFEQLGETHALPKKQAHMLLADFVSAMTTHLHAGVRIWMSGLGTLEVKSRAARTGRNPATGGKHSDQGQQEDGVSASKRAQGRSLRSL